MKTVTLRNVPRALDRMISARRRAKEISRLLLYTSAYSALLRGHNGIDMP